MNKAAGQEKELVLNMGPQHPSTHGVLRVILTLDGEKVLKAVPEMGYLHTGIEKSLESKLYYKALPLTDRRPSAPMCRLRSWGSRGAGAPSRHRGMA